MSILHVYLNKIFISLPTQPLTHTHNPHRYHTKIHTTHWQKTRKTNLAKWIKTHLSRSTSRLKQQNQCLRWWWRERETRSTPPVAMARTRNKINDLHRHLRWRWREWETRSTPPKASGGDGDGDGERHSTPFNPKPTTQAHSTRKQRETKEESAIDGGGDRRKRKKGWWEEESLMRGRKRELCTWEGERGS